MFLSSLSSSKAAEEYDHDTGFWKGVFYDIYQLQISNISMCRAGRWQQSQAKYTKVESTEQYEQGGQFFYPLILPLHLKLDIHLSVLPKDPALTLFKLYGTVSPVKIFITVNDIADLYTFALSIQ